jgi:hypothetical protein
MPVIEELLIGMMAVVIGLIGFATLIQVGLRIVKLLKLPQDPPEGAWFSPPAPPLAKNLSAEEARARALRQAGIRRLAHQAMLAQRAALLCRDRVHVATDAALKSQALALADEAKVHAEAADKAWRGDAPDAALLRASLRGALQARRKIFTMIAMPDDDGRRRKRILILCILLIVAWIFSLTVMFAR